MIRDAIQRDGERYLPLELVAELYQLDVVVLREAYALGLLGTGVTDGPDVRIAAYRLDVVASLVRWNRICGLDVQAIALRLGSGSFLVEGP